MKRSKRPHVSGQAIILELVGETFDLYRLTCWCVRSGIPFKSPDSYRSRKIDSMEEIYCPECEREHRLVRFWEASALGLFEPPKDAEGLDTLLGPPRLIRSEDDYDLPLGPRRLEAPHPTER